MVIIIGKVFDSVSRLSTILFKVCSSPIRIEKCSYFNCRRKTRFSNQIHSSYPKTKNKTKNKEQNRNKNKTKNKEKERRKKTETRRKFM